MTEENTQKPAPAAEEKKEESPTEKPQAEVKAEEKTVEGSKVEEKKEEPTTKPTSEPREILDIKPGMTVRVHQRIRETNSKGEEKVRIQIFEGIVIAKKHGQEAGATITVRKISDGIGVEKIFPLNSPNVVKIEPVKQAKVRRAKLYFLRNWKKKLKEKLIKN